MTSSTKPEVHIVSQRRQRKTELQSQATCIDDLAKFVHVVFEMVERRRLQTHSDCNSLHILRWWSTVIFYSYTCLSKLDNGMNTYVGQILSFPPPTSVPEHHWWQVGERLYAVLDMPDQQWSSWVCDATNDSSRLPTKCMWNQLDTLNRSLQ